MIERSSDGLAFQRAGTGENLLVLLHGNGLDRRSVVSLVNEQIAGCVRVAVDLPGHGGSVRYPTPDRYAIGMLGAALARFVDELNGELVILAGHSLGGHLALAASRALDSRLAGVMVWGTPPLSSASDAARAFSSVPELATLYKAEVTRAEAAALADRMYAGAPPSWVEDSIRSTDGNLRLGLAASIERGEVTDERALLNDLRCPVAVLHGELDALVRADYLAAIEGRRLWRQRVQTLPGGSHNCHEEQPSTFLPLMVGFVEECLERHS